MYFLNNVFSLQNGHTEKQFTHKHWVCFLKIVALWQKIFQQCYAHINIKIIINFGKQHFISFWTQCIHDTLHSLFLDPGSSKQSNGCFWDPLEGTVRSFSSTWNTLSHKQCIWFPADSAQHLTHLAKSFTDVNSFTTFWGFVKFNWFGYLRLILYVDVPMLLIGGSVDLNLKITIITMEKQHFLKVQNISYTM